LPPQGGRERNQRDTGQAVDECGLDQCGEAMIHDILLISAGEPKASRASRGGEQPNDPKQRKVA
jgi:hypothetical protein